MRSSVAGCDDMKSAERGSGPLGPALSSESSPTAAAGTRDAPGAQILPFCGKARPPMASASAPAREKLASANFERASASAPIVGSLTTSLTTFDTIAACRAWSARIAAWSAMTCAISRVTAQRRVRSYRWRAPAVSTRDVELAGRQRESVVIAAEFRIVMLHFRSGRSEAAANRFGNPLYACFERRIFCRRHHRRQECADVPLRQRAAPLWLCAGISGSEMFLAACGETIDEQPARRNAATSATPQRVGHEGHLCQSMLLH